jgi:predicted  nucleic acid-binding Zn-ribbon protein
MKKSDLGKFHVCSHCGAKFFDLKKQRPACPRCGVIDAPKTAGRRDEPAPPPPPRPARKEEIIEDIPGLDDFEGEFDGEFEAELDGDFTSVTVADEEFGDEEEEI